MVPITALNTTLARAAGMTSGRLCTPPLRGRQEDNIDDGREDPKAAERPREERDRGRGRSIKRAMGSDAKQVCRVKGASIFGVRSSPSPSAGTRATAPGSTGTGSTGTGSTGPVSSPPKKNLPTAVVLLSGGLDSATATALALEAGFRVIGLSFDYGQRHRRELEAAERLAGHYALSEHLRVTVNLAAWGGSTLTDRTQPLPSDGVQPDVIPSTYVPGRNTVFIDVALSLAEARGAERIVLGVNAIDYSGYPDCRPDYLDAFQHLADLATRAGREGHAPRLWAPLLTMDKLTIVREALRLGVPIADTWSCYAGGSAPCGVCDSCRIRDRALREAGLIPC